MAGMYPENETLSLFGEEITWPGVDSQTGKFTNGDFSNPLKRPSFIPADTINLILDNLAALITSLGRTPDNSGENQLRDAIAAALALKADLASPRLTGTPAVPAKSGAIAATASPSAEQQTAIATEGQIAATRNAINGDRASNTQASIAAGSGTDTSTAAQTNPTVWGMLQNIWNRIFALNTSVNARAPIANPTFTGTPNVPAVSAAVAAAATPTAAQNTRIATVGQLAATRNAINGDRAPIASPALSGTPTAPTAAVRNNNTQIATTAYADRAAAPILSYYTQYPVTGQTTLAGMFPASESPGTLFGGTWSLQYDTEEVFFRTPGQGGALGVNRGRAWNAAQQWNATGGVAGIEPDAIRDIVGSVDIAAFDRATTAAGAFRGVVNSDSRPGGSGNGAMTLHLEARRSVPTDTVNRPRNRLIRIWKRTA